MQQFEQGRQNGTVLQQEPLFVNEMFNVKHSDGHRRPGKRLLFSLTKRDFEFQTFASGGPGGQHQNKTQSGVRIVHPPSGAVGESREHRSQHQNKAAAFKRLIASTRFMAWHRLEVARRLSKTDIDAWVEEQMRDENIKVEYGA